MPLENDTLLNGRYRIQDTLGKGGMGAVYVAIDESLGVRVALKENLLEDQDAIQQFRKEATILAGLRHPNLPRVTDHFVIEGQGQYLVMDYIEGEDLKMRLQRLGALPEKEVLLMGIAISDALNYLHTLTPPVLHRDIKPGNIRITPRGEVYLVDFGLAKQVEGGQATATGARGLTPGYSPPEQYGTARTDARSDIYALGATLYTALAGFPPEDGLAVAINQTKLTPMRQRNPKISQMAATVIEKALAVKSEDRYQTGAEFKIALLEASETVTRQVAKGDVTVSPTPDSATVIAGPDYGKSTGRPKSERSIPAAGQPVRKSSNVWLWLLGGVGLIAIIGAAALGISLLMNGKADVTPVADAATATLPPTEEIEPTQDNAANPPAPANTLAPLEEPTATFTPAATPQGGAGMLAFASDQTGEVQIYLLDMATLEITQVTKMTGGACQPSWSPDGMRLVFTAPCQDNQQIYEGSTLFTVNMDGSNVSPLTFSPIGDYDPAWSPNGDLIAFSTIRDFNRPQVWTVNINDGTLTNLSNNAGSGVSDFQPDWSPDGEWLVFSSVRGTTNSPNLWIMDTVGNVAPELNDTNNRTNQFADWGGRNGDTIFFTQMNGTPKLFGIEWNAETQTSGSQYAISNLPDIMREPDLSPDGLWVVFAGGPDSAQTDLYFMRINGSEISQLTEMPSNEFDPVWRPTP